MKEIPSDLSWVVLPVRLGPSLAPESRVKSPPALAAGVSWVFPPGGQSGSALSFGMRHFLTLSDLPSAWKKAWSPSAVKIRKEKKIILLGNNCWLVTHIACYMKMKILIELTWTFSMEGSVFIKLLIIPPSSWID